MTCCKPVFEAVAWTDLQHSDERKVCWGGWEGLGLRLETVACPDGMHHHDFRQ